MSQRNDKRDPIYNQLEEGTRQSKPILRQQGREI